MASAESCRLLCSGQLRTAARIGKHIANAGCGRGARLPVTAFIAATASWIAGCSGMAVGSSKAPGRRSNLALLILISHNWSVV